ncbi:unnamed protein product [Somion occarium]|uniref:DNA polymerase n=1 Tax=Somion occarium TaxID=3059160 RepID=A0ABP1CJL3_9APHY
MNTQSPTIRVRINQIDSTVSKAGPLDDPVLARAPILRIYGKSSLGKKVCLHVHQYIARLIHSLNHAIALSLKRNPSSPNSKFIRAIILVKGVHFYGFHSSYSPFLKILVADPAYSQRAVTILQSGSVMKTRFRIYESHLSYILQFLCDFGLYGCGWIDLAETWQRGQDEDDDDTDNSPDSAATAFKPSPYFRESRMPLELDVVAHQILNRHNMSSRNLHHELKIPGPPMPSEPLVLSVRELWEDERQRRMAKGLQPTPVLPKDRSAQSRQPDIHWVAEARWWEEIRKRIERERDQALPPSGGGEWERWVMTTFESVEVLWEGPWRIWKPAIQKDAAVIVVSKTDTEEAQENPYSLSASSISERRENGGEGGDVELEVDEVVLSSQGMGHLEMEDIQWDRAEGGQQEREDTIPEDDTAENEDQVDELVQPVSPTKSELRTPTRASTVQKTNAFQRAWAKLVGAPQPRFPSVTSDISPARSRASTAAPTTPPRVQPPIELPQNGPVYDASPDNPFLDRTPRAKVASGLSPNIKAQVLYEQLEASTKRHRHPDAAGQVQEDDTTSDSTTDSDSNLAVNNTNGTQRLSYRHEQTEVDFYSPTNVSFERDTSDNNSAKDVEERPTKRIKLTVGDDDLNPFAPEPEHLLINATVPRYERPVEHVAETYTSLSESLKSMSNCYEYAIKPPSTSYIASSFDDFGLPSKIYRHPYYSVESDAPEHPREYAGLVYNLQGGEGIATLEEWVPSADQETTDIVPRQTQLGGPEANIWGWEYASVPPSVKEVRRWLGAEGAALSIKAKPKVHSQIEGPTQANPYGMNPTIAPQKSTSMREKGNMEIFALEVFAPSRDGKLPDPGKDEVAAVFWSFYDSDSQLNDSFSCESGVVVVDKPQIASRKLRDWSLDVVGSELDLLNRVVDVVQELDPDIVVGWDVQAASWGYLNARAKMYEFELDEHLSRAPSRTSSGRIDRWGMRTTSTFKVVGRHVLNLWRIIRAEQNFTTYSFEHTVFQFLRRRTPRYSSLTLTSWYHSHVPEHVSRLLRYFAQRTSMVLEIIDIAQIVTKTAEFARVYGVDFFSVLSRGSQFKVEAFMFRIAKPESFVLLSPSREDVGKQNAAECMPLIMEPLSAFYNSPVLVLDFESLYPSVMIAYNYCYSTCLGRVVDFKGQNKFGVTELRQPPGLLDTLKDHINVAPNGHIYVKPEVRKGLLGRMLTELLDTRVMVKQAMKGVKDDKALGRILNARQLGLKFIANVTYGYTSATFSGRMPAVEIADSIVQSGRETLEKAIRTIDSTKKWGAKVVYGDTDSVFVYLRGKTKEQAFRIGQDMVDTITAMNPAPVKLKFEKVYLPCVLLAKKRYVGFKFENPDDVEPVFDAKGIETVRRDGVPAQQKMVETCLKILFRTQDLSRVKDYCCNSWARMLENRVSVQDFVFSKEVKMGTYSDKVPPPPGVAVAARRMVEDPGYEPQYGERVPYVIIRGKPLQRLVDRAVSPEEVLNDSHKYIDASYYISRVLVPPLERILNLVGADVRSWYDEMPKILRADQPDALLLSPRKPLNYVDMANRLSIDEHFLSSRCLTCDEPTPYGVCLNCRRQEQSTITGLLGRIKKTEIKLKNIQAICSSCQSTPMAEPIQCESLDCPWLFERKKIEHKTEALSAIEDYVEEVQEGVYPASDSDSQESIILQEGDEGEYSSTIHYISD